MQKQQPLTSKIDAFDQLDLADGLKELLETYGFTLELLRNMSSDDLAELLGIDKYVARIIIHSLNPFLDLSIDKNDDLIRI